MGYQLTRYAAQAAALIIVAISGASTFVLSLIASAIGIGVASDSPALRSGLLIHRIKMGLENKGIFASDGTHDGLVRLWIINGRLLCRLKPVPSAQAQWYWRKLQHGHMFEAHSIVDALRTIAALDWVESQATDGLVRSELNRCLTWVSASPKSLLLNRASAVRCMVEAAESRCGVPVGSSLNAVIQQRQNAFVTC